MKHSIAIFTALVAIFVPSLAFAADQTPAAVTYAGYLLTIAAPVAIVLLLWLGHRLLKWAERKLGIQASDSQVQLFDRAIYNAVGYADERARKALLATGTKLAGPEKLEIALRAAAQFIEMAGLPALAADKLSTLIEAKLPNTRPIVSQLAG